MTLAFRTRTAEEVASAHPRLAPLLLSGVPVSEAGCACGFFPDVETDDEFRVALDAHTCPLRGSVVC